MNIRTPEWYIERIAQATTLREVYAAAGLEACAKVMQEEINRLSAEGAKPLAELAAAKIAERKQVTS